MIYRYGAVFRMADSIVSDTALTVEEAQIFDLLEWTLMDNDPNAHACRLKISLATSASDAMTPPWNLPEQLAGYATVCR
jgi:hypothetical protein